MGSSEGTHVVVGGRIGDDLLAVRFCEPDGSVHPGLVKVVDEDYQPRASDPVFVPCTGSEDGRVFHRPEGGGGRRGPANVNSEEYCEGYDRIFRKKTVTSPAPDEEKN